MQLQFVTLLPCSLFAFYCLFKEKKGKRRREGSLALISHIRIRKGKREGERRKGIKEERKQGNKEKKGVMPDRSGFADAPVTRALLFYLVAASLVVALADVKDLVDLRVRSGGAGTGAGAGADAGAYDGHGGHGGHGNEEAEDMLMSWGWWVLERVWRLGVWQVSFVESLRESLVSLCFYFSF